MATLDLAYEILDLQLIDVDGRRCGRVDDVELGGEPLRVVALLSGPGVFPDRLPFPRLRRFARRRLGPSVLGANVIRIPWEDVDAIGPVIRLRRPADELGLARAEREIGAIIARVPGASE
jgi:sporulation protein YlmC with PRC-barrel domain